MTLRSMKLCLVLVIVTLSGCTKQDAQTVADITVKIADGVCKEEAQQPNEPAWVAIACQAETAAGPLVHVLMPREEWNVVRGRKPAPCTSAPKPAFDGGPGK